jgi:hypothetical protein
MKNSVLPDLPFAKDDLSLSRIWKASRNAILEPANPS